MVIGVVVPGVLVFTTIGDTELCQSWDESNHDIGAEEDSDMSSSDEVLHDISETRTTEVLNVESDGNHDDDAEEDGANESSDDEFPITNRSKMASYDKQIAELNKTKCGDELGTSSCEFYLLS